jgi:lipopolysaccharide transport protein LptA
VFRRNVEVRRGDLTLRADWLQALYPPDAKQPSHLAARGGVTVVQGTRSARCARADYENAAERIVCRGDAELRDGDDRIVGEQIVFDLGERRVRVAGDVQVLLQPRAAEAASGEKVPPAGMEQELIESDAPLAIQSDRLEALDRDGRREILFEGNVEVARSDATLRSDRLEALYPERARQPDRLVATGDVAFTQGTREARCERAT